MHTKIQHNKQRYRIHAKGDTCKHLLCNCPTICKTLPHIINLGYPIWQTSLLGYAHWIVVVFSFHSNEEQKELKGFNQPSLNRPRTTKYMGKSIDTLNKFSFGLSASILRRPTKRLVCFAIMLHTLQQSFLVGHLLRHLNKCATVLTDKCERKTYTLEY